ncbi:MAG: hypothetical protein NPIRA04_15320 [Nitrospirales bacterium]|nr:MAG: hypothetical protein NPIRA04_15320 [Nitrospirales bacterium]
MTENFHRPWAQAKSHVRASILLIVFMDITLPGCALIERITNIVAGTVSGTVWVLKGVYELTIGTTKIIYHIRKFTFVVVRAPLDWPLMNDDLETIDGLPVKEAIRQGRV